MPHLVSLLVVACCLAAVVVIATLRLRRRRADQRPLRIYLEPQQRAPRNIDPAAP